MAKKKSTARPILGPLQKLYNAAQVANDQSMLLVITPEQRAKGTYEGERRIINNHDPVQRWIASGKLTESQQYAIGYVRRLWEIAGLERPITVNYGHMARGAGCAERRAAVEIDAREDLHRVQDYVPAQYWSVFELVCRYGEPAGVAGSGLGAGGKAAQTRAHTIVCFVADTVAMKERL
jgi:hypothetical protein